MNQKDNINQILIGLQNQYAIEIFFGFQGFKNPTLMGEILKKMISSNQSDENIKETKIKNILLKQHFGNSYLTFSTDEHTYNCTLNKTSLTLTGVISTLVSFLTYCRPVHDIHVKNYEDKTAWVVASLNNQYKSQIVPKIIFLEKMK